MADRYAVPFQAFITNGAVITSDVTGRVAAAGNTTLTLSTTGGAGTFTITLGSGCTGTVTSGSATITGSVLALAAGANTVTSNGAGTCTLNLTLGTAANTNDVNTWSAATGGVSGASVPTSADNTIFNANSFTAASQVLTVDAAANCLNMTWTGATNTPTLAIVPGAAILYYGNVTFIAAMVQTGAAGAITSSGSGAQTLTTNGLTIGSQIYINNTGAGSLTLQDNLTVSATGVYAIGLLAGILNTNERTVALSGGFQTSTAAAKTLTPGASAITCTSWNVTNGGGAFTLTANTSTIIITGADATARTFAGGSSANYNNLTMTGAGNYALTISGNNTFNTLTVDRSVAAKTLTLTAGTTQTVRNLVILPYGTTIVTINSSGTVTDMRKIGNAPLELDYLAISNSRVSPLNTWLAGSHSTDGGGNMGWIFKNASPIHLPFKKRYTLASLSNANRGV